MGVAVVIGWWFGSWLDRKLDTEPWLMIVFLLFGVAAGFMALYRALRDMQRDSQRDSEAMNAESKD